MRVGVRNQTPRRLPAEKRRRFIQALEETGQVLAAAERIGVKRIRVYEWRERHADFAAEWDQALATYLDRLAAKLEDEAVRRGVAGVCKPVFYKGERVDNDEVVEYSDSLLALLLKTRHPAYRAEADAEREGKRPVVARPRPWAERKPDAVGPGVASDDD